MFRESDRLEASLERGRKTERKGERRTNIRGIFGRQPETSERGAILAPSERGIPFRHPIKKFKTLPITSIESCYGHTKRNRAPYLIYLNDDTEDPASISFQNNLIQFITNNLEAKINESLQENAVAIDIVRVTSHNHSKKPLKGHRVEFIFRSSDLFKKRGKKIIETVWREFVNCLNSLDQSAVII